MADYVRIPSTATLSPEPFTLKIPDQDVSDFKTLLRLSPLAPKTYENLQSDGRFGVTYEWISNAKKVWETEYNWREREKYINSFPNYTAQVKDDDGEVIRIHFAALFSDKEDAIPVLFMHGWPGSHLEFLPMLSEMKRRYSPSELPFHAIVPSLPGYSLSSGPPLTKDWGMADIARVMDKLMVGLGFGSGYAAQGGDVGSFTCRPLGSQYPSCKAVHLNFSIMPKPASVSDTDISEVELIGLKRTQEFLTSGSAYSMEHGTRPSTVGFALSSSPLALLAWIGEKFIEWSDTTPELIDILDSLTLYWFTQSFPRCIYPYRDFRRGIGWHDNPEFYLKVPVGYSWFPKELAPMPLAFVKATANVVWHRYHTEGGHFAALEKPELLLTDVEEFLKVAWPQVQK